MKKISFQFYGNFGWFLLNFVCDLINKLLGIVHKLRIIFFVALKFLEFNRNLWFSLVSGFPFHWAPSFMDSPFRIHPKATDWKFSNSNIWFSIYSFNYFVYRRCDVWILLIIKKGLNFPSTWTQNFWLLRFQIEGCFSSHSLGLINMTDSSVYVVGGGRRVGWGKLSGKVWKSDISTFLGLIHKWWCGVNKLDFWSSSPLLFSLTLFLPLSLPLF